jgi:hypothetical protein
MKRTRLASTCWFVLLALIVLAGPTLAAQASDAVRTVVAGGTSAPAPNGTNEWGSSVVWAFLSSTFLEWIKRNRSISILSERSAWIAQRLIGIALAFGAAAGIHASFDGAAGVLTVSGLLWPDVASALGETVRQWVFQEISYRTAVKPYHSDRSTP